MVDERAGLVGQLMASVSHSTASEGQRVPDAVTNDWLLELVLKLRDTPGLWRDDV